MTTLHEDQQAFMTNNLSSSPKVIVCRLKATCPSQWPIDSKLNSMDSTSSVTGSGFHNHWTLDLDPRSLTPVQGHCQDQYH